MTTETKLAYRPDQAARMLSTSRDTIFKMLRTGELKGFKIGQARFISATELESLVRKLEGAQV